MTNQIEAAIKIASDSVQTLRACDVFRVLEQNGADIRNSIASYISLARPDLADEVSESIADLA